MKTHSYITAICLSVLIGASASAQSGSMDQPSISAEAGHVYISNRTSADVVFYLESENTKKTEHRLAAGSAATYTGAQGDSWFNIEVYSNGTKVMYGLDAGTRHYLEWNAAGILDVLKMPAR